MIDKQKIYNATSGGLDVFAYLWPDARRVIAKGDTSKAFKIRPDERTGSAHLKQKGDHWWPPTSVTTDRPATASTG